MRTRTLLTAALVTILLVMAAAPALAGDVMTLAFTEGETESEVVEEEQGSQLGIEPAVEAPPTVEAEEERPWTQRFLAPAVLVLGLLALIGSVLYYGARVRGRYRVAQ